MLKDFFLYMSRINSSRPIQYPSSVVPVKTDSVRTGVENTPSGRRHLLLNPEAFAPTPPEYLAPWLFFGKPNTVPSVAPSSAIVESNPPVVQQTVPEAPPNTSVGSAITQPSTTLPQSAAEANAGAGSLPASLPPQVNATEATPVETSPASAPSAELPTTTSDSLEEENKAGLPQEKDKPLIIRGFDNSVIRNLNRRLEDPDWQKRAEASNDFSMILGANPNLERRPAYKPYIDAFMLKILRDTSAVVHEPALRSIQVGYYRHPTAAVIEELNVLKTGIGLFGLEPQMVTDALYSLHSYQQQEQVEAKQVAPKKQAQKTKPQAPAVPQTQLVS